MVEVEGATCARVAKTRHPAHSRKSATEAHCLTRRPRISPPWHVAARGSKTHLAASAREGTLLGSLHSPTAIFRVYPVYLTSAFPAPAESPRPEPPARVLWKRPRAPRLSRPAAHVTLHHCALLPGASARRSHDRQGRWATERGVRDVRVSVKDVQQQQRKEEEARERPGRERVHGRVQFHLPP